jgi:signal transduction histidine kinase
MDDGRESAVTQDTARPPVRKPRLFGSLVYLVTAVPLALFTGLLMLVLTVAGATLTAVWIGIPVLMLVVMGWRGVARMERRWLRTTLHVDIPAPYQALPQASVYRRWRAKMRDPATRRDIVYVLLRLPLSVIELMVVVLMWGCALALAWLPLWAPGLPAKDAVNLPNLALHSVPIRTVAEAAPYSVIGIVLVMLAFWLTPRIAQLQALLARALLAPTAATRLAATAQRLQASRARGVDAAEAERRRIERDLHDGAQQRLVSVAMTLGRAKKKLEDDPDSARQLIDEAHADAKLAVAELRDLARGIYPAVLGDRGLDAALSALAARCPVPVDVLVDVSPRPPTAVESTAYFIVAEALTNVAKYSTATSVKAVVRRDGDSVVVQVSDDGAGGAVLKPGGGLAGLADRAATIDGVMTVHSPAGGPTIVTAELPCAW